MLDALNKIKAYCDYLEEHYMNVQKAWKIVESTCADLNFIADDSIYFLLKSEIEAHDQSKLSSEEFIPYAKNFCPGNGFRAENKEEFTRAWDHHKEHNPHHWQHWTKLLNQKDQERQCVHMVVDWMAMGIKFQDNAQDYYEKKKKTIDIPEWAEKLCYQMFERVYK